MSQERNDELIKKPSFWISQIAIIIATIAGVYLAANQGFNKAMLFDNIRSDKSNYYLRLSLKNELENNIKLTENYIQVMRSPGYNIPDLQLTLFIWDSLRYSPQTLETPSNLLSESQNFYFQLNYILKFDPSARAQKAAKIEALISHMKDNVLPEFDKDLDKIKSGLKKNNVEI